MRKVAVALAMIASVFLVALVQNDRRNATVWKVNGNCVAFEVESGDIYEWESKGKEDFRVGDKAILVMFDYEDFDPTNDEIVAVWKR